MTEEIINRQFDLFKKSEPGKMCGEMPKDSSDQEYKIQTAFHNGAALGQVIVATFFIEKLSKDEKKILLDYLREETR